MLYTDLNSEIEVGASGHLLEIGDFKILLDCGMHPKLKGLDALPSLSNIEENSLDFIAISHAHLDHCGAIPVIAKKQEHANIMVAQEGQEILLRMLRNSRNIMGKQREEYGIKEYPLFDYSAIDELSSRLLPMLYGKARTFEMNSQQIHATFFPAGHIMGASAIMFEHKKHKVLYSGDISFKNTGILKGAKIPDVKVDTLIVESTRGAYSRPKGQSYETEVERLISSINRVIQDGGSVLIPSFALGRTQELLQLLYKAKASKKIPNIPIYTGGLGLDIAESFLKLQKHSTTYSFQKQYLEGVKAFRQAISAGLDMQEKAIYILGSGMMLPKTPSYALASALIEHQNNAIFFVGYCDEDTPAAKLLKTPYSSSFSFDELMYVAKVNAKLDKFDLTSHAEREELLEFILKIDPRNVILTHGGIESREWLMYEIMDISPKTSVYIPEPSETISL